MSTNSSKGSSRRSSLAGKSYAPRGNESRVGYPTRLPEQTYEALMAASSATGTSGNSIVVEALEHYLSSREFRSRLEQARKAQEEAIKKLSGG